MPSQHYQAMLLTYKPKDITQVISLRAHAGNPWVLDRLARWPNYYNPAVHTVIVDMGSEPTFGLRVKEACEVQGFRYHHLADSGTYSQAVGRNAGARLVTTPLVFFNDADCFGPSDLFQRLAAQANALDLDQHQDRMVNLPVYHLTQENTEVVSSISKGAPFSEELQMMLARAPHSRINEIVEFISPFSNSFLCRSDFFDYVGGYNERFRGHGSEDFEFLIRFAQHGRYYPLPENVLSDRYNPARDSFYQGEKKYHGFRRLGEVMAFSAETAGLRMAHLHHPRGSTHSSWHSNRDVRRRRFQEQLTPFLEDPQGRLSYDWVPRGTHAIVVGVRSDEDCRIALTLRSQGYRLIGSDPGGYDAQNSASLVAFAEDRERKEIAAAVARAEEAGHEVLWLSRSAPGATRQSLPANSYLAGRLGLGLEGASIERVQQSIPATDLTTPQRLTRRLSKMARDPHRFLRDSRFRILRAASKAFVAKD